MALTKKTNKKGSHTVVTFTVEASEVANSAHVLLLGDFNDWQRYDSANQMEKEGDLYVKSVELENGKRYEFRYLSDGDGWLNDSKADDYVPSPFDGIHNSVVDLPTVPAPVKKKAPVKKTPSKEATAKKKTTPKAAPKKKAKKDDLKKIEGIGPKISSILTEKGIGTFKKLSEAPIDQLEAILKEAGPRFSMHKPGTWPQQALLASEGKWEELRELQDSLKGGREVQ